MTRPPFPEVPIATWTITRPDTAGGLFAERCLQAQRLIDLPDLGDGDLDREQRRAALRRMVNGIRPLAAVSIFLGVVALEDYVRDLGARLADDPVVQAAFPNVTGLRPRPMPTRPGKPFARLDQDPATPTDFAAVNKLYLEVLGAEPFPQAAHAKLYDLALIRHTVAHHGSVVRPVDIPRFQYWSMKANAILNPPVEFVEETLRFLYQAGRAFELTIQNAVFAKALASVAADWAARRDRNIVTLIELFNYFGRLPSGAARPVPLPTDPDYEARAAEASDAVRDELLAACLEDLGTKFPFMIPDLVTG